MQKPGTLRVDIRVDSQLLSRILPIEIRDSSNKMVRELTAGQGTRLPPGLYGVSTMLEDGRLHKQTVHLRAGRTTKVSFSTSDTFLRHVAAPVRPREPFEIDRRYRREFARGRSVVKPDLIEKVGLVVRSQNLQLISSEGASPIEQWGRGWRFVPEKALTSVPIALLSIRGSVMAVSLPVNPSDTYPRNSCIVEASYSGRRVSVSFAPERTVAATVLGMMRSGQILPGLKVASEATDLLSSKYSDPVGAALGGLLLHRLGRLGERRSWVENLARDFAWLPDGSVLLAALLSRSDNSRERRRGLAMLLGAAGKRMMFADGFSLCLTLLRRWPDRSGAKERMKLLASLAETSASVDWGNAMVAMVQTDFQVENFSSARERIRSLLLGAEELLTPARQRQRADPEAKA
jgi:hypothetical protein